MTSFPFVAGTSGVGVGATAQKIIIGGTGFEAGATVGSFVNASAAADANVTATVTAVTGTSITATVAITAGDTNTIDGYTESQRFFLSFAQNSCENQTFFSARQSMSADPHSVGQVRVNSAVQNFQEFGRAFHCAKGKPMYPEQSCRVW